MKKLIISIILALSFSLFTTIPVQAQELGANFNENLELVFPSQIERANVLWVRAFVNVMECLTISNNIITGVDDDAINALELDSLISATQLTVNGENIKLIFTFKFEFDDTFMGRVPEAGSTEIKYIYSAMKQILQKDDLGTYVDILVVGNEPMWETPTDDANVSRLTDFTNEALDYASFWKKSGAWNYDIYVGALNRFAELSSNSIRNAILNIAKTNDIVVGLDLHPHMIGMDELGETFVALRETEGFTKDVIVTEFSLHRLFVDYQNTLLGTWGTEHGYSSSLKMYQWVNSLLENSEAGENNSKDDFMSYFNAQSWYPQNWFTQCWDVFKKYNVKAATYGFVRKLNAGYRISGTGSDMWVLNAYYNQALFGNDETGFWETNPMVYSEFNAVISSLVSIESEKANVNDNVDIYPVPANEVINVKVDNAGFDAELYNMTGKLVKSIHCTENNISFNIDDLPKGCYLLKINQNKQVITKKVTLF